MTRLTRLVSPGVRVSAVALTALLGCSLVAPPQTSSSSPSVVVRVSAPRCDSAFESRVPPAGTSVIPADAVGERVTLFYATHTHGALIRSDGLTFAHYAAIVAQLRAGLPATAHSLFLGNGDDLNRYLCNTDTGGAHVVEAFNSAGLDVDTYGFNEVDASVSALSASQVRALIAASRFQWVSANVIDARTGRVFGSDQGATSWTSRTLGSVRVAITGVVGDELTVAAAPRAYGTELVVRDPIEALKNAVPAMRAAGAQVVIVLSHLSRSLMERVAHEVAGVDAILGAHDAFVATMRIVNDCILTNGYENMGQVGQLDLLIDGGKIRSKYFSLYTARVDGPLHPGVNAVLSRFVVR